MKNTDIKADDASRYRRLPKKLIWIYSVVFSLTIILLSGLYLNFTWNRYEDAAGSDAIILAESLKSLLHTEQINMLSGNADDLSRPEYIMLKESLNRLVETTNDIRFAYLLGEKDGNIMFFMDSESPDSPDYSFPGQVYSEADEYCREAFRTGETLLTKPSVDRWGTWISVLVPIKDPSTGKVTAVFGIDFPAREWTLQLQKQMIPDYIIVLCLIIILIILLHVIFQHSKLRILTKKLTRDEALYHSIFNQAPLGIAIVKDKSFVPQSEFGDANINPACERILGRSGRELAQINWPDITHPDDLQEDLEKFGQFKAGRISLYSMEKRFFKPDGLSVWTNMHISHLLNGSGENSTHLCLLEDITDRKKAESALAESERSKSVLLSRLPGMAYRCSYDAYWTMQFVSEGCFALTGYKPESLINNRDLSFNDLITPEYRESLWNEWARILPEGLNFKYEYEITTACGERKWVLELGQGVYDENRNVEALEGLILDISDRKVAEEKLRFYYEHDSLTGLFRYRYLINMLEYDAKKSTGKRALVGINLSSVQSFNITYGFYYTKDLMKRIADCLRQFCTDNYILFRTYESQLAFYIKGYKDKDELAALCSRIAETLGALLAIERIGGGIGVVEIDENDAPGAEQLLMNLLIASQKALSTGDRNFGVCFYNKEAELKLIREEEIKQELTRIAGDETDGGLYLQYQPIYDLQKKQICGFEALARMKTEKLGRVPPLEFIPLAEETKLIIPIGQKIIRQAFQFLKKLKNMGYDHINVSVNVSPIQLLKNNFTSSLFAMIDEAQINPENIGIEITESVIASDYESINEILSELKSRNIIVSIDDFGTGFSSLARERELKVSCLKIDKYFIDNLLTISHDNVITGDIISMAHKLGHCVVAEGVEYERQMKYLLENGCDKIQGYLISKPLDEDAAIELLNKQPVTPGGCAIDNSVSVKQPETVIVPEYTKEQLRLILDSTADAIYGIDTEGKCTFCNKSCLKLLGYNSAKDLLGKNMHEKIHHTRHNGSPFPVEECMIYNAMIQGKGFDVSEEVFWRADGTSFDVEYHSYPQIINGKIVGGVITFNDITEKKKKDEEIRYLSCHDALTGLFNRRCFEKALIKVDVRENLPLSVVFVDINGLKMTNDIFGHNAGDRLIKKTAEILKESCGAGDIVARVGGDEFVILLPATNNENAQKIIERIRSGFRDARIEAIKCSTSIGCDTKTDQYQSLEVVVGNAENAMYKDKTINRQSVSREIINTIVETLHSKIPGEKQHSIKTSEMCGKIGAALGLPVAEISKLKRAGYLHDIGKIIIDDSILLEYPLEDQEQKMRPHTVAGYRILNLFDDTLDLADYVYSHHERWDGAGYPRGLKGEQIPLISRIISIAECYNRWANTGNGTVNEKKAAIDIIRKLSGTRFDPDIVEKFARMMENSTGQ